MKTRTNRTIIDAGVHLSASSSRNGIKLFERKTRGAWNAILVERGENKSHSIVRKVSRRAYPGDSANKWYLGQAPWPLSSSWSHVTLHCRFVEHETKNVFLCRRRSNGFNSFKDIKASINLSNLPMNCLMKNSFGYSSIKKRKGTNYLEALIECDSTSMRGTVYSLTLLIHRSIAFPLELEKRSERKWMFNRCIDVSFRYHFAMREPCPLGVAPRDRIDWNIQRRTTGALDTHWTVSRSNYNDKRIDGFLIRPNLPVEKITLAQKPDMKQTGSAWSWDVPDTMTFRLNLLGISRRMSCHGQVNIGRRTEMEVHAVSRRE